MIANPTRTEALIEAVRAHLSRRPAPTAQALPPQQPLPISREDAAVVEIQALRRELGRLPELREIVARTDIPKTTAWRALKRVAVAA